MKKLEILIPVGITTIGLAMGAVLAKITQPNKGDLAVMSATVPLDEKDSMPQPLRQQSKINIAQSKRPNF